MFFLKKTRFIGALFVFVVSFAVYFATLAPTIFPGDGPELIAASYNWGVSHSPGYPLLTLITKGFITVFPFGSVAWRVNLLNALLGSLTLVTVYFIIHRLLAKKKDLTAVASSVAGSLFLGFSSAFWLYSITAEVFSLHHFLAALMVLVVLIWREKTLLGGDNSDKWLFLLTFLAGLSFANQQAIVFLAPPFLFLILITDKKVFLKWRVVGLALLFLALGLIPYLYLIIAASLSSAFAWGNPDNLRRFFGIITREGYGGVPSPEKGYAFYEHSGIDLWFYAKNLYFHFTAIGILLGVAGFYFLRKTKEILVFLAGCLLFAGPFFLFYLGDLKLEESIRPAVAERFVMLSELFFAVFLGCGAYFFLEKIKTKKLKIFLAVILGLSFVIPLSAHYHHLDLSENTLLYDFGTDILNSADQDSLLISKGDMMFFSLLYLQEVEEKRTDVKMVHQPLLTAEWYVDYLKEKHPDIVIPFSKIREGGDLMARIKELVGENAGERSVYYPVIENIKGFKPGYFPLHREFVVQLIKGKPDFSVKEYIEQNRQFYEKARVIKNRRLFREKSDKYPYYDWEREIQAIAAGVHNNKCFLLHDLNYGEEAEVECQIAVSIKPDFSPAYLNLGDIYYKRGLYEEAISYYEKMIEIDPVNLGAYKKIMIIYRDYLGEEQKANEYLEKYKERRTN